MSFKPEGYGMRDFLVIMVLVVSPAFSQEPSNRVKNDARYNAVQWMQNSAEYVAATTQAYRLARLQLAAALANKQHTADEQQAAAGGFEEKPPAIILDVDETVLDNSPFQARSVIDGLQFDPVRWSAWVAEASATAIPGAVEFIRHAQDLGVAVFLVTNRRDSEREGTVKNLKDLGVNVPDDNLLLRNDEAGRGGDKLSRRAMVAEKHRVLLLIGDNIADLCDGVAGKPAAESKRIFAEKQQKFGQGWVMIPNPSYGGWERTGDALITLRPERTVATKANHTPKVPVQSIPIAVQQPLPPTCAAPGTPVYQQIVTPPAGYNRPRYRRRRRR